MCVCFFPQLQKLMADSGMFTVLEPEELSEEDDKDNEGDKPKPKRSEHDELCKARTKENVDRAKQMLQYHLKTKEGTGDGQFVELLEFPVFWQNKVSRRLHGTHIETESCTAALIQSQSTGKRYVNVGHPMSTHLMDKALVLKAIADTEKMLSSLRDVASQLDV